MLTPNRRFGKLFLKFSVQIFDITHQAHKLLSKEKKKSHAHKKCGKRVAEEQRSLRVCSSLREITRCEHSASQEILEGNLSSL